MKKFAIGSIAAFYLLLTTGMFVCIVHCATDYFFHPQIALHEDHDDDHEAKEHHHGKEKDCKGDKDCSCCNKHDNFVIKENVKPGLDFNAPKAAILIHPYFFINPITDYPVIRLSAWQQSNAPPGLSGKSIIIKLRTLLI
jgi:hypothetical protein